MTYILRIVTIITYELLDIKHPIMYNVSTKTRLQNRTMMLRVERKAPELRVFTCGTRPLKSKGIKHEKGCKKVN